MKVYISPSRQFDNIYKGMKRSEAEVCAEIGKFLEYACIRNGITVKRNTNGTMYQAVSDSNAFKPDIHICIHTNAGGGKGPLVMVNSLDASHKRYANPVYYELKELIGDDIYGVRVKTNLYEIKNTTSMCIYCECEFHDDAVRAKWIVEHTEEIGEALCKGLCTGAGIKYKAPAKELYTVQVGAYANKKNAQAMAAELKSKGYEVIVKALG